MDNKPILEEGDDVPVINNRMAHLDVADPTTESGSVSGTSEATSILDEEVDAGKLASEMQERCRILLKELEQFQAHLKRQRKENTVEVRTFRSGLQAEKKLIDKVTVFCLGCSQPC